MRLKPFLPFIFATGFAFICTASQAREAPRMVTLGTGSSLATWTVPSTPETGGKVHQTPIIYLHGGPGMYTEDRRIEMGRAFRAFGFTTIFYDQIGSGQSSRVPATQYTTNRMIADLEAFRIHLGTEKMVLWGNSWGAQLALLYAQAYPARVAGFVLTSPGEVPGEVFPLDYSATKRTREKLEPALIRAVSQIRQRGPQIEARLSQSVSGRLMDTQAASEVQEGMVCKASNVSQPALQGGANLFVNSLINKEVEKIQSDWRLIPRVPALVVRGVCDFLPSQNASRYVAITGGTGIEIQGVGHGLMENPAAVERILALFARDVLTNVP